MNENRKVKKAWFSSTQGAVQLVRYSTTHYRSFLETIPSANRLTATK